MVIVIVIAMIVLAFIVLISTIYIVNYLVDKFTNATTISFSTWLKFYELEPDNWDYNRGGPAILYSKGTLERRGIWYRNEDKVARVNISFLTAWQYYLWKWKHEKQKAKELEALRDTKFLSYIQEDIDEARKKAAGQIEKSMKDSQECVTNLLKETRD